MRVSADFPSWEYFSSPIALSLKVSVTASIIVFVLGLYIAWLMNRRSIRGRVLLETLIMLPLVLPPTVVGFLLLTLFGRSSWIGRAFEALFRQPIIFTWGAAVLAAVVVALPLVYQTAKVGFASIDQELEDSARALGANERQLLRWITLPLARRSLIAAYLLGFARALGEFGATLMIAGSIPGKTQTIPTAIYIAVESGHMALAWWWTLAMILISLLLMLVINSYREKHE
jgi:molybdate transport system permease protein